MDDAGLNPFHNRPAEWALYSPLVGTSMLELGDKRNGNDVYKTFFEQHGFRHVSVDLNGKNGALVLDLRKPLDLGTFDMVTNIGTSEHVSDQRPCWQNIVEACAVGSVFVSTTPAPGDWQWHGDYYPTDKFYEELADMNGFSLDRLYPSGAEPRRMWFCRMTRRELTVFSMPKGNMYFNPRQ